MSRPPPAAAYLRKYMKTATASRTIVRIQRDESLIPVFLAMRQSYPRFSISGKSQTPTRTSRNQSGYLSHKGRINSVKEQADPIHTAGIGGGAGITRADRYI